MKKQGGGMKEHKEIGQREPNFAAPNWQHRKKERKESVRDTLPAGAIEKAKPTVMQEKMAS